MFVARQQLRFLLSAPYVVFDGKAQPLVAGAMVQRDTAYLPLQLVSDVLPRLFSERYRYDVEAGRLMDAGWQLVKGTGDAAPPEARGIEATRPRPRAARRHACGASTWSPSTRGMAAWTRATRACSSRPA